MIDVWQKRRSEFNHDWLKNNYIKAVNAFISRLGQQNPDSVRILEFLNADLPNWKVQKKNLQYLLSEAENALSPRRLFDEPPLSRSSIEIKKWLPQMVHDLWVWRSSIQDKIEDARKAYLQVDSIYNRIINANGNAIQRQDIKLIKKLIDDFRDYAKSLSHLSSIVHTFPNKVSVL